MSAEYEIDMSVESIPSASEVECEVQEEVQEAQLLTLELMVEHLPSMDPQELLELMAAVNAVLKKKWKSSPTKKSVEKVKKPAPKALKRNQAWIAFTLKHAMDNGWEAYTIHQETKNKTTGETVPDDTARSGSVPNDADTLYTFKDKTGTIVTPAFIYEDTGKHFIYKEAMSLSAQWKWTEGARPAMKFRDETEEQEHWSDLFREFIAGYEDADADTDASSSASASSSSSSSSTPSSPVGRRLTAAEREEERAEKRRIAEEEKEVKRQAREEKKEESRQKKEQEDKEKEARRLEREEKKAEKDRLELEKKAEKEKKAEAKKSPPAAAVLVKRSPVPAAKASSTATKTVIPAPKAPAPAPAPKATTATATAPAKAVTAPAKAATAPAPAKAAAPKQLKPKMTFDIEEDSLVHEWTWEGNTYLVNSDKCVWEKTADGEAGEWVGMVDLEKEIIDTSVPEPAYEDE